MARAAEILLTKGICNPGQRLLKAPGVEHELLVELPHETGKEVHRHLDLVFDTELGDDLGHASLAIEELEEG
jgi:hypothetical protein